MLHDKRILAVVPARGGSKGIPLKNLKKVGGKSLVTLVGDVCSRIPCLDRCIVSTDHEEIARVADESGLDAPFFRPEELSGDQIGDLEVLTHALLAVEDIDKKRYDIILMLQPTSPLRKPEHVTRTLEHCIIGQYDAVWTLSETDTKGHPLKQLILRNDLMDYYDPAAAKIIARQQLSPTYHRNGVAYAITRDCLLEQKTIKGEKTGYILIEDIVINIDTEMDLKLAEFFLRRLMDASG